MNQKKTTGRIKLCLLAAMLAVAGAGVAPQAALAQQDSCNGAIGGNVTDPASGPVVVGQIIQETLQLRNDPTSTAIMNIPNYLQKLECRFTGASVQFDFCDNDVIAGSEPATPAKSFVQVISSNCLSQSALEGGGPP